METTTENTEKKEILASIQTIRAIEVHNNADSLEIATILNGYKCIVKKGEYKQGDLVVFIFPDSILPDKEWATFYKSKSSRVRAIKLRGVVSFGIVESITKLLGADFIATEGQDLTDILGITKYEPPAPQDLSAKGLLPYGIPKTDEKNYQSLDETPYGEICDISTKIDGMSSSYYVKVENGAVIDKGILGRTMEYKEDAENKYAKNNRQYKVLEKLEAYCLKNNVSLCLRGESYGEGIQKFSHNPHSKLPLSLALYSTWLIDENKYARKGHPLYIFDLARELDLPTVKLLEKDVKLTKEIIHKYSEGIEKIDDLPFEGVVIQWKFSSFKVINLTYDSKK